MEERKLNGEKKYGWMSLAALVLSVVAVVLAGTSLYFSLRENQAPEAEPVTFQYGGRTLVAMDGVPVNPYDATGFSVDQQGRNTYAKDGFRGKTGVDVSTYQGEIDWEAVKADGIDFAMIRLGYRGYTAGGLMMDDQFEANLKGALDAGLDVGIYFFSQAVTPQEAEAEAAFVLNAVEGHKIAYPIAFDWEPVASGQNARTDGLTGDVLTKCAAAFCDKVRSAGYIPAVYFNQDLGYLHYDLRELSDYVLWLAEYDQKPDFYYAFDIWQYTHTGRVEGIQGDVDLNLDLRP